MIPLNLFTFAPSFWQSNSSSESELKPHLDRLGLGNCCACLGDSGMCMCHSFSACDWMAMHDKLHHPSLQPVHEALRTSEWSKDVFCNALRSLCSAVGSIISSTHRQYVQLKAFRLLWQLSSSMCSVLCEIRYSKQLRAGTLPCLEASSVAQP